MTPFGRSGQEPAKVDAGPVIRLKSTAYKGSVTISEDA